MRVVVDLLGFTGTRGGTETYTRELSTRLPSYMPEADFIALANTAGDDRIRQFFPGEVRTIRWVGPGRAAWAAGEILAAGRHARRLRADVLWTPANFGPISRRVPRVATIHDVIYHEVPGGSKDRATRAVTSWLMARSARSADAVVTISRSASQAIQRHLDVPADRIHVILNGSTPPKTPDDPRSVLAPLRLPPSRRILLSTGNRMPHKNFEGLLRALAAMDATARPLAVIPGAHGDDPLHALTHRLGLERDVILPGWVSGEELESLYAVADVYVCPSLAEGFGLPVVDALRRGCRVVANDIPVLREVGADAVTYADARSPGALAQGISRALAAPADPDLRAAATAWAESFTWDESAKRTARVLTATAAGESP